MQAPCSCDVHRGCTLGFVEDVIPRARANEASTIIHQVMCRNPALHEVHQDVDLHGLFQQIRGIGRLVDTAEERAIAARVTAAKLRLNRRPTTPTGKIDLSRNATERGEEDTRENWLGKAPQQPQVEAPCWADREHITDRHRLTFAGRLAHTEWYITYRGPPAGERIGSGQP